jgi:hypothetical protein
MVVFSDKHEDGIELSPPLNQGSHNTSINSNGEVKTGRVLRSASALAESESNYFVW